MEKVPLNDKEKKLLIDFLNNKLLGLDIGQNTLNIFFMDIFEGASDRKKMSLIYNKKPPFSNKETYGIHFLEQIPAYVIIIATSENGIFDKKIEYFTEHLLVIREKFFEFLENTHKKELKKKGE